MSDLHKLSLALDDLTTALDAAIIALQTVRDKITECTERVEACKLFS
jgi:hypothetical protein